MKKFTHYAIAALFVALLIFSNDIISVFTDSRLSETECLPEENKQVLFTIDSTDSIGNLAEEISVQGWAFCETSAENDNKKIKLLFSSKNHNYSIDILPSKRTDVYYGYVETKQIRGINHGIVTQFSTIGMKSGTYKIYIYCEENEEDYGLAETNYRLIKDGRNVSFSNSSQPTLSSVTKTDTQVTAPPARAHCDILEPDGEKQIHAVGWAFCETDEDNSEKTIQLVLRSESGDYIADTLLYSRPDVYEAYKEKTKIKNEMNGFNANVNLDNLPDGEYELLAYCIENDSASGITSLNKHITKSGDTFTIS